jgi:hypothetical protein
MRFKFDPQFRKELGVPTHLEQKKKAGKYKEKYNGYLEKSNPRAHEMMSRKGV